MAFTPKDWQNYPSQATPRSADAMIDLETRLSEYTDAQVLEVQDAASSIVASTVHTFDSVTDPTNDDKQILHSVGGANPLGGNLLEFPTSSFAMQFSTAGEFASTDPALNVFQFASYLKNTGQSPAVPIYGQGVGQHVWGANFVGYAKGDTGASAIGVEVDCGNYNTTTTTVSGAQAMPFTTLNVSSTTGAATAGNVVVGGAVFAYTGKTSTTFTGVTALNPAAVSASLADGATATYSTTNSGTTTGLAIFSEGGRAGGSPINSYLQFSSGGAGDQGLYGINYSGSGSAGGQQPLRAEGAGIRFQQINTAQAINVNGGNYTQLFLATGTNAQHVFQIQTGAYTGDILRVASASAANGINFTSATFSGNAVILGAGHNVQFDSATGTKLGTNATQKLGFWGTTPVIRPTGWGSPTGTATRTAFATGSVTLPALAEAVKALIDDLKTEGLLGA